MTTKITADRLRKEWHACKSADGVEMPTVHEDRAAINGKRSAFTDHFGWDKDLGTGWQPAK